MGNYVMQTRMAAHARMIAHIWLPGFYCAAEAVSHGHPNGAPLVVVKGRQVLDASKGARAKGIEPGMSAREARLACPDMLEVMYAPERYAELAESIWTACARSSPAVEPLQEHEAFMDLTGCRDAPGVLGRLSRDILDILGIEPEFGVASSRLVARIASGILSRHGDGSSEGGLERWAFIIGREREFLAPMPVGVLWPLHGEVISRLERLGVRRVGEIQAMSRSKLVDVFGATGHAIHEYSLGVDRSAVVPRYPKETATFRKTFEGRLNDESALMQAVREGASSIARELGARAATAHRWSLVLELGHADRVVLERRPARPPASREGAIAIFQALLVEALARLRPCEAMETVDSVSLAATDLVPATTTSQIDMFDPRTPTHSAGAVDAVAARLRRKFGTKGLFPASLLELDRRDRMLLAWEACYHHEEDEQVSARRGAGRSTSEGVLLEGEMASSAIHSRGMA